MSVNYTGDAATTRTNLGLGDAATKTTGTAAGNIPVLDGSGSMPAVDGSALTGIEALPSGGTVGQVLTNTASGTGTWQDAAGGAWTLIQSQDITSNVTGVEFTNIPSGYDSYQLIISGLKGGISGLRTEAWFSANNGTSWDLTYKYFNMYSHLEAGGSGTFTSAYAKDVNYMTIAKVEDGGAMYDMSISGLTSADNTLILFQSVSSRNLDDKYHYSGAAGIETTTVYNAMKLVPHTNSWTAGRFSLYGVSHS